MLLSKHDCLYADAHLTVAVTPTGLLAVPGRGAGKQDCLSARLAAEFGEIHIVHRLDQATSGLMVFARNLTALKHLQHQFSERLVNKTYEAVIHGKPEQLNFSVDLPLMADWPNRPKQKVDIENGKPSLTHIEVLNFNGVTNTSRVRLTPVTGRTHQLRVHLQAIGHPVVGDRLYGADDEAPRLMLHASHLALTHPHDGARLAFDSAPNF